MSGIFDLTPLIATTVNETLRLDDATAVTASPAFWPVSAEAVLNLWVGETEASEYFRQSHDIAERWRARGARTSVRIVPAANHFTAPAPLAEPASPMTRDLISLCAMARDP